MSGANKNATREQTTLTAIDFNVLAKAPHDQRKRHNIQLRPLSISCQAQVSTNVK